MGVLNACHLFPHRLGGPGEFVTGGIVHRQERKDRADLGGIEPAFKNIGE